MPRPPETWPHVTRPIPVRSASLSSRRDTQRAANSCTPAWAVPGKLAANSPYAVEQSTQMNINNGSRRCRMHPCVHLKSRKETAMKKFTVIVAADVPHYGRIDVEATSAAEAERLVAESFEREGFDSLFWEVAAGFEPDWSNCQDLRTVDSSRR